MLVCARRAESRNLLYELNDVNELSPAAFPQFSSTAELRRMGHACNRQNYLIIHVLPMGSVGLMASRAIAGLHGSRCSMGLLRALQSPDCFVRFRRVVDAHLFVRRATLAAIRLLRTFPRIRPI
jgi:hypothetical protein